MATRKIHFVTPQNVDLTFTTAAFTGLVATDKVHVTLTGTVTANAAGTCSVDVDDAEVTEGPSTVQAFMDNNSEQVLRQDESLRSPAIRVADKP